MAFIAAQNESLKELNRSNVANIMVAALVDVKYTKVEAVSTS